MVIYLSIRLEVYLFLFSYEIFSLINRKKGRYNHVCILIYGIEEMIKRYIVDNIYQINLKLLGRIWNRFIIYKWCY